jgi:superfamily I DNA/RNA helicase
LTHGPAPQLISYPSAPDQGAGLVSLVKGWVQEGVAPRAICVVARLNAEIDAIACHISAANVPCHKIVAEQADSGPTEAIRVATMHRVKGLEFDRIIVASANEKLLPLSIATMTEDPVEQASRETEERSLLYVALTRAKSHAVITSYGASSAFVSALHQQAS